MLLTVLFDPVHAIFSKGLKKCIDRNKVLINMRKIRQLCAAYI